jgi:hypothetical protein
LAARCKEQDSDQLHTGWARLCLAGSGSKLGIAAFRGGRFQLFWRASSKAIGGLPKLRHKRRSIKSSRRSGLREIARTLVWNPAKMRRRQIVIRPIEQ